MSSVARLIYTHYTHLLGMVSCESGLHCSLKPVQPCVHTGGSSGGKGGGEYDRRDNSGLVSDDSDDGSDSDGHCVDFSSRRHTKSTSAFMSAASFMTVSAHMRGRSQARGDARHLGDNDAGKPNPSDGASGEASLGKGGTRAMVPRSSLTSSFRTASGNACGVKRTFSAPFVHEDSSEPALSAAGAAAVADNGTCRCSR